jgi:hypothetical protein
MRPRRPGVIAAHAPSGVDCFCVAAQVGIQGIVSAMLLVIAGGAI